MQDLISRQAAIDALEKVADMFPWRVPGNRDTYDRYNEAWNDAIGRAEMEIENLPSAQPERWIPCSERLPFAEYGESNNVLATCGYRDVEDTSIRWIKTLYFNGGVWCYPTGETYEHMVYAWMPLPEPYKEGEQK